MDANKLQLLLDLPIEQLIPQSDDMVLIDKVVSYQDDFIETTKLISPDSIFLDKQCVPAWVSIEYMAQTIAAYSGITSKLIGGDIKIGFLVGSRNLQFNIEKFPIGSELSIQAKLIFTDNVMGVFECSVFDFFSRKLFARGNLNVYQPESLTQVKGSLKNEF